MSEPKENRDLTVVGRRETDRGKCAMHDLVFGKNDECIDIIKKTIRDEVRRMEHRTEILEGKMQNYISKWAMGMILAVATSLLGGIFGLSLWQTSTLNDNMNKVTDKLIELNINMTEFGVKQVGVLAYLKEIEPEHLELMRHMESGAK